MNGSELKAMLENGVSLMPSAQGRFPQVSGLCFTFNVEAAAGSRVTSAVRQAANGTCTGAPVDLTSGSTYKIAENDFMMTGGDGYPVFTPPGDDAGHHGSGHGGLHHGELADLAVDPGPDPLLRSEPRRGQRLPGRVALDGSFGGPPLRAADPRSSSGDEE